MTQFILNNKTIKTNVSSGMTLLDFIRNEQHLKGTKTGCREGDCGACSILVGTIKNDEMVYQSMTSCIMPLANAAGKHIVTVEGINRELKIKNEELTPIQAAMHEESATQCGFCTVGFVMSMTGVSLQKGAVQYEDVIESIDGNICRCTGYKSIERAAQRLTNLLKTRDLHGSSLDFAIKNQIVPAYFADIKKRVLMN
jgi:xanthine dehydrogenase small subunit